MDLDIDLIKKADPRHEQLIDALDLLRKAQKHKQEGVGESFSTRALLIILPYTYIASYL
jgi:hypothetical protein